MKLENMSVKSLVSAGLLGVAVLASSPSFAELTGPQSVQAFKAMDTDKDGKLQKDEYLRAMGKIFDQHAGAKGYCTPEEAAGVLNEDYRDLEKYAG